MSFEKPADRDHGDPRTNVRERMSRAQVSWFRLRYHKRLTLLARSWEIVNGARLGAWLAIRERLALAHARSYVPSMMALTIKKLTWAKYSFDMRGFWADERVDGGLWRRGSRMYRVAKWFKKQFLLNADHVACLTHAAAREIATFPDLQGRMPLITAIPTCVDRQRFRPMRDRSRPDGFVLGYFGSACTWYLFEAVARSFKLLCDRQPDARLLVVSRHEHEYIRNTLSGVGVDLAKVEIVTASHDEVPRLMARMSAGIFFIKPVYSKLASAPTKLGGFLGCGIPCLSNSGVGDMAEVLEGGRVGVARYEEIDCSLAGESRAA